MSRRRPVMGLLLLCGGLWGGDAWGAAPEVHLAQARIYLKRSWYDDAAAELRAAVASPEGRSRHDICWLAAGVAWEILDLDWALEMAEAAAAAAPDDAQRQQALALAQSYREGFGFLTIEAPYPGMVSRLQLESTGLVVDPERKRYLQRAALVWHEPTPLPARMGLPVGSYLVNGHAVTVLPGQEVALTLPMRALGARGLTALQVTRLEASIGIRSITSADTATGALLPSLHSQITLTQPAGPVLLGASIGLTQQAYRGEGYAFTDDLGWTLAARLGREVVLDGGLSLRPSLTGGHGRLPGTHRRCDPDPCLQGDFAVSALWSTGGELLLEYRPAGRTTALGTGVKLHAAKLWGQLPSTTAHDGEPSGAWTATELLMLANLSLAL